MLNVTECVTCVKEPAYVGFIMGKMFINEICGTEFWLQQLADGHVNHIGFNQSKNKNVIDTAYLNQSLS